MIRRRLEKLEHSTQSQGIELRGPAVAAPLDGGKFEMWGEEWTREELGAIAKQSRGNVIIVDL